MEDLITLLKHPLTEKLIDNLEQTQRGDLIELMHAFHQSLPAHNLQTQVSSVHQRHSRNQHTHRQQGFLVAQ
jgi:hypothetical protein